ncbi:MAG: hypothetical protein IT374_09845 [Polyangiaceae bacterium]|nr:hypothetical protein [Polyangiaceae bacterium]
MSEAQPPVAFRLRRPYATEDEFVAGDGAHIERGGMTLIGAGARPVGLVVRFEVALRDGAPLFRGEGRVTQHRARDGAHPGGLDVRFTRLDPHGKVIVERVLRERAAASSPSPAPVIPDLVSDASDARAVAPVEPPPPVESGPVPPPSGEVAHVEEGAASGASVVDSGDAADALARLRARPLRPVAAPVDAAALLGRLRARRA